MPQLQKYYRVFGFAVLALVISQCKRDSSSSAKADDTSKAAIYLGPEDKTSSASNIFVIATANDVMSMGICLLDSNNQCPNNQMLQAPQLTTQHQDRKFFQSKSGLATALNNKYRVYALDSASANLFTLDFVLASPDAGNVSAWKVLLYSSENGKWDAIKSDLLANIKTRGVADADIKTISSGNPADIKTAFSQFTLGASDACFLYLGARGVVMQGISIGSETLTPDQFDLFLSDVCGIRPTVVILSADYSGKYSESPVAKDNRIIISASASDLPRTAHPTATGYSIFDDCLKTNLNSKTWADLDSSVRKCVNDKELNFGGMAPSKPNSSIGKGVSGLAMFNGSNGGGGGGGGGNNNVKPAVNLGANDFTLTSAQQQQVKISSLFGEADYLMLDASSVSCGYCHTLQEIIVKNAAVLGSKCAHATMVLPQESAPWISQHGQAVAKTTFETNQQGQIIQGFGATFGGTPSVVVIDRTGKKVYDFVGLPDQAQTTEKLPDWFTQNCK